jgi:tetratricopeptide (TPR) repeat protein
MHRKLALAAALFIAPSMFACIWTYGTDAKGKQVQVGDEGGTQLVLDLLRREPPRHWEKERKRLADPKAGRETRNDYAVALMHLSRAAEAIPVLVKIEKEHPGLYPTAANLGTAYELAGDNVRALQWIAESIRRNGNAHDGTEWLHVRILEAKLAHAKDPRWFTKNSTLGIDTGTAVEPKVPATWPKRNDGKPGTRDIVANALRYQLRERLQFVSAPDPVVADLFYDWGNLAYHSVTLETAEALYLQAVGFGVAKPLAKQRLAHVQGLLKKYKKK